MHHVKKVEWYVGKARQYTATIARHTVEGDWVHATLHDIRCVDTGAVVIMECRCRLPYAVLYPPPGQVPLPIMPGLRVQFKAVMAMEPTSALYMPEMEEPTLTELSECRVFNGYMLHRWPKPPPGPRTTGRRLVT